jgi:hypothetical protein
MLKNLLAAVGIMIASNSAAQGTGLYSPYTEPHVNFMYNLLFCDDVALFKKPGSREKAGVWERLLTHRPDKNTLLGIASDESNEGRVRALAYKRMRAMGVAPPPKKLLGVIVEVPLSQGLDVLAAFSEGGVRYLNQSGKVVVFEGQNTPVAQLAQELIAVSQPIVDKIGPWEKERLPPPKPGNVRITFLVSDGLYFGEGPFKVLQSDDMAGPVLSKATQLLQKAVEPGSGKNG